MKKILKLKKYLLFCLIALFATQLNAQKDSNYVYSYQLEGEAWHNWDSIYHVWMVEVFPVCLKENNLKMSCANCVYIYIDAGLTINQDGKLIEVKIFKENICSGKASDKLKKCFLGYFQNMVFPVSLRNMKIVSKFGTGLKC